MCAANSFVAYGTATLLMSACSLLVLAISFLVCRLFGNIDTKNKDETVSIISTKDVDRGPSGYGWAKRHGCVCVDMEDLWLGGVYVLAIDLQSKDVMDAYRLLIAGVL